MKFQLLSEIAYSKFREYAISLLDDNELCPNPMPDDVKDQFRSSAKLTRTKKEWVKFISEIHIEIGYYFMVSIAGSPDNVSREGYPTKWSLEMRRSHQAQQKAQAQQAKLFT